MELPAARVAELDADFAQMAIDAGQHAFALPGLSLREKAFVWMANDVCTGHLGLPFELHLQVARDAHASWQQLREVLRHLAPYAGYPAVVEAFDRLRSIQNGELDGELDTAEPAIIPTGHPPPAPGGVDADFADWVAGQEDIRWRRGMLTSRERILLCLAVDIAYQTPRAMRAHLQAGASNGVDAGTLRALLRLMGELAIGKVWQANEIFESEIRHGDE
ncbi:MAG: carboxymuconolactone decarboxylase family protein [Mycobacterium sp.]